MSRITLTGKGRRWIESGHPWAFADDLAASEAEPGELVLVEGPNGKHLGYGLYSRGSKIAVRLVTRAQERPERGFWQARVERALAARARMGLLGERDACRLIGGDADGIPGLVVDRYAGVLVTQCGTQAADRMRDLVLELVEAALPWRATACVDRSDSGVRKLEGLEKRVEVVRGELPRELVVDDGLVQYEVDVLAGHKTGHYLDQRDNRRRAARLAQGGRVLDAFCYDGLFGIACALAGARAVVGLDQSAAALERARRNAERNGVADKLTTERADVLDALRAQPAASYELAIVDPPAFARNRQELAGAARGYGELNRRALGLVAEGGHLVSASCSYNVKPELFVGYLRDAAARAGRAVWLEELCGASPDHPQLLTLPETAYLKCAFLRVGPPALARAQATDTMPSTAPVSDA